MLAFVIPFKPKRNSRNWEMDSRYLKQTIQAMLQQTSDEYCIIVVLNDMPEDTIVHSKVDYLVLPDRYRPFEEIGDGKDQLSYNSYYSERDVEYQFDQGRKQMYGAMHAIKQGASYVMCVDADDLVFKGLVEFVENNHKEGLPGWFVNKGYFLLTEESVYVRQPYAMNMLNGSTYIIHKDFLPPFELGDIRLNACNFFSNHPYLEKLIEERFKCRLLPLPFYASVVQITSLNWWKTNQKIQGNSLKQKVKYLFRRVLFPGNIKKEFKLA